MTTKMKKEEVVLDPLHSVLLDKEGARSGGECNEPERRAPSRPSLSGVKQTKKNFPDSEVVSKATRRRFSAAYKKKILEESEALRGTPGAIGALLRREGLYSSHLTIWKKKSERGELQGLSPKKRGRKPEPKNLLSDKLMILERENSKLRMKLDKAETIIAFQKKLSEMLGISLEQKNNDRVC
jgi:transposase-like protein